MSKKLLLKLFKKMLRIRMVEERIAELYPKGEMRTPTHFSIGQEAVSVGVCESLRKDDWIFSSHRCHAAYLSKGGDLRQMIAELYGRSTGACAGKSGSAHLTSVENNMYSAPILAAMVPVAAGVGLSASMDRKKNISVAFFGDAAFEEGACAETINFAVLKNLPVFFVCENNFFSTHTHIRYRQPKSPIFERVKAYGIKSCRVDGMDVRQVYKTAGDIADKIRHGFGPIFMECVTYRFLEHVGPNIDFYNPYRTKEEVELWMKRCPVERIKKQLIRKKYICEKDIRNYRKEIIKEIDDAVGYARRSSWPGDKDLLKDVY